MSLDPVSRMNGSFFFFAFRVVFSAFVIQGVKPLGQPFHQLFDQVFSLKLSALSRNQMDNVKVCSAQTFIVCVPCVAIAEVDVLSPLVAQVTCCWWAGGVFFSLQPLKSPRMRTGAYRDAHSV